jgi:hypothetical protein
MLGLSPRKTLVAFEELSQDLVWVGGPAWQTDGNPAGRSQAESGGASW